MSRDLCAGESARGSGDAPAPHGHRGRRKGGPNSAGAGQEADQPVGAEHARAPQVQEPVAGGDRGRVGHVRPRPRRRLHAAARPHGGGLGAEPEAQRVQCARDIHVKRGMTTGLALLLFLSRQCKIAVNSC